MIFHHKSVLDCMRSTFTSNLDLLYVQRNNKYMPLTHTHTPILVLGYLAIGHALESVWITATECNFNQAVAASMQFRFSKWILPPLITAFDVLFSVPVSITKKLRAPNACFRFATVHSCVARSHQSANSLGQSPHSGEWGKKCVLGRRTNSAGFIDFSYFLCRMEKC